MKIQSKDNRIKEITDLFFPWMPSGSAAQPSTPPKWSTFAHHLLITARVIHAAVQKGTPRLFKGAPSVLSNSLIYPRESTGLWQTMAKLLLKLRAQSFPGASDELAGPMRALRQPLALAPLQPGPTQLEAITPTSSRAERVADGESSGYQSGLKSSRCLQQLLIADRVGNLKHKNKTNNPLYLR